MSHPRTGLLSLICLIVASITAFTADEGKPFNYNTVEEIKVVDFALDAFDLKAGVIYFTVKGTKLFYMPEGADDWSRVTAVASISSKERSL